MLKISQKYHWSLPLVLKPTATGWNISADFGGLWTKSWLCLCCSSTLPTVYPCQVVSDLYRGLEPSWSIFVSVMLWYHLAYVTFSSVTTCLTLDLSEPAKGQKTHGGKGQKERKSCFYDDIAFCFLKTVLGRIKLTEVWLWDFFFHKSFYTFFFFPNV